MSASEAASPRPSPPPNSLGPPGGAEPATFDARAAAGELRGSFETWMFRHLFPLHVTCTIVTLTLCTVSVTARVDSCLDTVVGPIVAFNLMILAGRCYAHYAVPDPHPAQQIGSLTLLAVYILFSMALMALPLIDIELYCPLEDFWPHGSLSLRLPVCSGP